MLRGLYTAASGMYAQQRKTDILTNNLANMNTAGFKAEQTTFKAFPEMLLQTVEAGSGNSKQVGSINTGVYLQETLPKFIQGDLQETGLATDIAINDGTEGSVFLTVQQNDQTKYTRNGQLTVNGDGVLTSSEGFPVLDTNGNQIILTNEQFTIQSDGTILENDMAVAQLAMAFAEDPDALIKEGSGLYRTEENAPLLPNVNEGFSISQGYIEGSNVDPTKAMTEMMSAYRTFEANQKILQAYDRSLEKAVSEVGRVNG